VHVPLAIAILLVTLLSVSLLSEYLTVIRSINATQDYVDSMLSIDGKNI